MLVYLAALECESDKTKFERIYLAYRQIMFRTANSILKDAQLSEDAVHQAFLRIINHMQNIEDAECPRTKSFVVIIVKNIALNLYNSRKKNRTVSFDELEDWMPQADGSPEDEAEDNESYRRLVSLIVRLPEGYRSVLLLKYDNGYSTSEIASMLGLSEENVKKRLQRARKKLEEKLGEEVTV